MPLGNLITKDDGWIYINAVIVYLVFLPFPQKISTSSIFTIVTLGISILTTKLSSLENLHKRIFKRQLIKSEIQRRRAAPDRDYGDLSAEGQEEVDKIDEYFHDYAKTFSALLIITVPHLSLIALQLIGLIPESTLTPQNYSLNSVHFGIGAVVINTVLMYDFYHEIRRYMFEDLKEVYSEYS